MLTAPVMSTRPRLPVRWHTATLRNVTVILARPFLESLYRDTITALHPGESVRRGLAMIWGVQPPGAPLHLLALGKAASAMSHAALRWVDEHPTVSVIGGLSVAHADNQTNLAPLLTVVGDHPTPGERSLEAAEAADEYIREHVRAGDHVLVLLSGGASSLIGAPRATMPLAEFAATCNALLGSGLNINQINRQRRQLARWGGGRLGAALQARGATVEVLVISDVIGDELSAIGSGPCIPDAGDGSPPIPHHVLLNNQTARSIVTALARERGAQAMAVDDPLHGDVQLCAERITLALLTHASQARRGGAISAPRVVCWGGEPTVTLPGPDAPPGGRMQMLAMLIAQHLHEVGKDADAISVLCAGTDGRDGPTNAAGAVVDAQTWAAMRAVGPEPERDLAAFRSHNALRAVQATVPAFVSATNVNDLVVAWVG
jgi:glycerate 2-kinase